MFVYFNYCKFVLKKFLKKWKYNNNNNNNNSVEIFKKSLVNTFFGVGILIVVPANFTVSAILSCGKNCIDIDDDFVDDDPGFDVDRLDGDNGLLFSIQSSKNFNWLLKINELLSITSSISSFCPTE